jgi:1,4-alpha-glucan branching enzyme
MIYKEPSPMPGRVRVTFELPASIGAERVCLVGSFNAWARERTPLRQTGPDGSWRVTLDLDTGREHQFRYVIDGDRWVTDVNADALVANGYGSSNSVVCT